MKKRHEELMGAGDLNESMAHVLEQLEALDRRVKALEKDDAPEEKPKGGKGKA